MSLERIKALGRQLYPTGAAFKMPFGGTFDKLNTALAKSEARAYADAVAIKDSLLPDNDNFTAADATDWERRLGIIQNPNVPLADRKLAIKRKYRHPGDVLLRQSWRYLEGQLQAAGFDVYVHENIPEQNPVTLSGGSLTAWQHGNPPQHGQIQHGGYWLDKIVNHIDVSLDSTFLIGDNLRSTFFIGGAVKGAYADIDLERKEEFRQLVLRIKPAQTVALLFINYTY